MGLSESYISTLKADHDALDGRVSDVEAKTKVYIKDAQGTPHYWQLTIDAGVLVPVDAGTTAPTDGVIGVT